MDPQQVVSNDCETQKDYIDDARLKKMMKETQPSFMERYGSCLVTFVLIAINVVVFGIEVVLNGFNPDFFSGSVRYGRHVCSSNSGARGFVSFCDAYVLACGRHASPL